MFKVLLERFREVLKSREIFSNWLSAAIHYVFINPRVLVKMSPGIIRTLGKGCIKVRCRFGGEVCVDPLIYTLTVRYHYLGLIKSVGCESGNNALIINDIPIKLNFMNEYVDLGSVKFKHFYYPILEVFVHQEYSVVDVNGRTVIDVGAYIGDSAIYFVLRGAKKVIAIEPHPEAYKEMLENIKLNNLEDKIIPMNAALGSKPGIIKITNVNIVETVGTYHGTNDIGDLEVPMITLSQLIKNYGVEPDVLKMDCEGCEYDVVVNDYDHVRLFRDVVMEYHGNLMPLLNVMRRDFDCSVFDNILYCRRRL